MLNGFDQMATGRERLGAMRRPDRGDNERFPRQHPSHPMNQHQLPNRPARAGLLGDTGQHPLRHPRIVFQLQADHAVRTIPGAHRAHE